MALHLSYAEASRSQFNPQDLLQQLRGCPTLLSCQLPLWPILVAGIRWGCKNIQVVPPSFPGMPPALGTSMEGDVESAMPTVYLLGTWYTREILQHKATIGLLSMRPNILCPNENDHSLQCFPPSASLHKLVFHLIIS